MYPSSTTWTSGCIHPGITELDEVFIEPLKAISWTSAFMGFLSLTTDPHGGFWMWKNPSTEMFPFKKSGSKGPLQWKVSSLRFWYFFQLWQKHDKTIMFGFFTVSSSPNINGFWFWKKIIHPPSENNNNLRQSDGILSNPGKLLASRNLTWNLKINETITHYQEEKTSS